LTCSASDRYPTDLGEHLPAMLAAALRTLIDLALALQ
jgi:hypothetical protein